MKNHVCSTCGKELSISVPPYLRKALAEQDRLCTCYKVSKMRMYDIGNKSRIGFWVCAKNEQEAILVALKLGHVKDGKNARVHDITDRALSNDKSGTLKPILDGDKQGHILLRGQSDPTEPKEKGWCLIEVAPD